MARKRIELYSAGCQACRDAEAVVRRVAGTAHDVEVRDMHLPTIANEATRLGIHSVPTVVIDGQLASCCSGRGVDEAELRAGLV